MAVVYFEKSDEIAASRVATADPRHEIFEALLVSVDVEAAEADEATARLSKSIARTIFLFIIIFY